MENISLALICTLLGATLSFLSFQRNKKSDIQADTQELTEIKAKLDYISQGVDEIKKDNKDRDSLVAELNIRVTRAEELIKTLYKKFEEAKGKGGF